MKKRVKNLIIIMLIITIMIPKIKCDSVYASEIVIPEFEFTTYNYSNPITSSIALEYELKSLIDNDLDISKIKLKYYITVESSEELDSVLYLSGITTSIAPFYVLYESCTEVGIEQVDPTNNPNVYCVTVSFEEGATIYKNDCIKVDINIFSKDLSSMNQSNDLSYISSPALLYDNYLLSGSVAPGDESCKDVLTVADKETDCTGDSIDCGDISLFGNCIEKSFNNLEVTYYTDPDCTTQTDTDHGGAAESGGEPTDSGTYYCKATYTSSNAVYTWTSNTAVLKINYVGGNYTEVDEQLGRIPSDLTLYTEATASAVTTARDAVVTGLDITHQTEIDGFATDLETAIDSLVYKNADYTDINTLLSKIPSDLSLYTEESSNAVKDAQKAIVTGLNITHQNEVDQYAQNLESAINALEIDETPGTGDSNSTIILIALVGISLTTIIFVINNKKSYVEQK